MTDLLLDEHRGAEHAMAVAVVLNDSGAPAAAFTQVAMTSRGIPERLSTAWTSKSADAQRETLADALQWSALIAHGDVAAAAAGMRRRAEALIDAACGPVVDAAALETFAQASAVHPRFVLGVLRALVACHPDADLAHRSLAWLDAETGTGGYAN